MPQGAPRRGAYIKVFGGGWGGGPPPPIHVGKKKKTKTRPAIQTSHDLRHSPPLLLKHPSTNMSPLQKLLLLAVVSYFLGSIPFGLLVGLSRGIDPRKAGSGNIGATNVARLLGGRYFALVFSLLPMLAAYIILRRAHLTSDQLNAKYFFAWLLVGFSAILGHMFPIYLRFKGGKGVATSAGLILGLWPYYTLPALFAFTIFEAEVDGERSEEH